MALSYFFKKLSLFELLVFVLTVLQFCHFCILYSEHAFPMPLLYGPIFWAMYQYLYGEKKYTIRKGLLLGNIPFVIFVIWYFILGDTLGWNYFKWYMPIVVIVQIAYPTIILLRLRGSGSKLDGFVLLKQLMALGIGISLFVAALLAEHYLQINLILGIEPIQGIGVAMAFSLFLLINHIYAISRGIVSEKKETFVKDEENALFDAGLLQRCQEELARVMDIERLYLDPKLSLDKLSSNTNIPKNIISQYLHTQLGLTYYEWLAVYRINYAKKILAESGSDYKLEAIAYSSGFSSKTTFNRYFKEIEGVLPSIYRERILLT